jgi:DNA-binding beta-propeller fold protein YncE
VQEIDYSNQNLLSSNEFEINSPAPHALSINDDGDYVYTISNTADWLYKISTLSGMMEGVSLDASVGNPSNLETQRLKPIQCVVIDDELLLISCSAGVWYDPNSGNEQIPGQIQLWNTSSMALLDTIQFSSYSTPWHIVSDSNNARFYVALAGDPGKPGYAGIACIGHQNNTMQLIWKNVSEEFSILHGIDMSADGRVIYVSGRGDDYLHVFDSESGEKIKSINLGMHAMSAGIKAIEK